VKTLFRLHKFNIPYSCHRSNSWLKWNKIRADRDGFLPGAPPAREYGKGVLGISAKEAVAVGVALMYRYMKPGIELLSGGICVSFMWLRWLRWLRWWRRRRR